MRIHTSLTERDVKEAAAKARVDFERLEEKVSRSAPRAFDVILAGSSLHACHWSRSGEYRAATWDEWGIFLTELFRRDPQTHMRAYEDADDFHWKTGDRFMTLTPDQQHRLHKWEYVGDNTHECQCGAVK